MKTIKRKFGEFANLLADYGNDATNGVFAGLAEDFLPSQCYHTKNRYEIENVSTVLYGCDDVQQQNPLCIESLWLDVQRAIDWDDGADITVTVADDADESDIEDAFHDAGIEYIYSRGIRESERDRLREAFRSLCGVTEEVV